MTLAAKDSRQITVDGVVFRWKVRGRPTYSQANGWKPLTFVAEHAERPGALLVVTMPCAHPGNWMGLPAAAVLPGTVASAITRALAGGWRPAVAGPPFALALDEQAVAAIHDRGEPRPIRRRRRRAWAGQVGGRSWPTARALVATGLLPAAAGARSLAEKLGIRYVYASHQPVSLPSPHHPPHPRPGRTFPPEATGNRALYRRHGPQVLTAINRLRHYRGRR